MGDKGIGKAGFSSGWSTVKRRILGEKIVKGIRFPVMTHEEFASVVFDSASRILTPDEITDIAKRLSSVKLDFRYRRELLAPALYDVSDLAQWSQVGLILTVRKQKHTVAWGLLVWK